MLVRRASYGIIAVLSMLLVMSAAAFAQLVGTVKDVETSAGTSGKVDWTTGVITSVGIGAPPANPANHPSSEE